jgi:hypothetical protein
MHGNLPNGAAITFPCVYLILNYGYYDRKGTAS